MRTRLTMSLAAVAVAALAGCQADVPPNTAGLAPQTDTQPSEQDRTWMRTIHQGNLTEVQAGRLAVGKGTTKQVKSIGKMLLDDHTALDTKVTQAASQMGVELPTSTTAKQRAELVRMQDASGQDFDHDFVAAMTKEHKAALAATKKEVAQGSSPAVVALAKAAEPALQKHLTALQQGHGE
ncbi:DUF4142 domain-containing protein [Nonomuraea sp. NPDC002799]